MIEQIRELGAKPRNLFAAGEFQKRYADGDKKGFIQVRTHNGRVVKKKEAFPYGFCTKAKNGRTLVFCQGGNPDGFEIFPVQAGEGVTPPELEEGDAVLYTGDGGWIVLRDAGG
jgi:phage gp45-like